MRLYCLFQYITGTMRSPRMPYESALYLRWPFDRPQKVLQWLYKVNSEASFPLEDYSFLAPLKRAAAANRFHSNICWQDCHVHSIIKAKLVQQIPQNHFYEQCNVHSISKYISGTTDSVVPLFTEV
jgi:hypothetical protein